MNITTDFKLFVRKSTSPVNPSYLSPKMSKCSIESYEDLKIPVTPKKETKRESDISDKMSSSLSVKTQTCGNTDGNNNV